MNKDRGMIKWLPFNSLINGKQIVYALEEEKSKIKMPIISEEEQKILEEEIIEAYYCQNTVIITYYKNGFLLKTKAKIKKIDNIYKTIYLSNQLKLLFKQIFTIHNEY